MKGVYICGILYYVSNGLRLISFQEEIEAAQQLLRLAFCDNKSCVQDDNSIISPPCVSRKHQVSDDKETEAARQLLRLSQCKPCDYNSSSNSTTRGLNKKHQVSYEKEIEAAIQLLQLCQCCRSLSKTVDCRINSSNTGGRKHQVSGDNEIEAANLLLQLSQCCRSLSKPTDCRSSGNTRGLKRKRQVSGEKEIKVACQPQEPSCKRSRVGRSIKPPNRMNL